MSNFPSSKLCIKTSLAAICLFIAVSCHAEELESLKSIYGSSNSWKENKEDFIYVGTRCSSLFSATQNLASDEADKRILKKLMGEMGFNGITELKTTNEFIGKMFLEATRLELGTTKLADETTVDLAQRTIELATIYKSKILKNNRIHNRLIYCWV